MKVVFVANLRENLGEILSFLERSAMARCSVSAAPSMDLSDGLQTGCVDHVRRGQSVADLLERLIEHRSRDDFGTEEGGNGSAADHDQDEADRDLGAQ